MGMSMKRWAAVAIAVIVVGVASRAWPSVGAALTALMWASWVVIAVVALRAAPIPARVRAALPVLLGRIQRVAHLGPAWLGQAVARSLTAPWRRSSPTARLRNPGFVVNSTHWH